MMKHPLCHTGLRALIYPLTALVMIGLSAPIQAESPIPEKPVDITGIWNANGYYCDAETPAQEKVQIEKHGEVFSAIKLVGDNCIPAGYETFHWDTRQNVCQIIVLDSDSTYAYASCIVEILSQNEFKVVLPDVDNLSISFQKESDLATLDIDLSGVWITEMSCYDQSRKTERVRVKKNGAVFTGIKLIGDECVPAGYMTFFWDSSRDICQATGAKAPLTPPSLFYKCQMSMVDENHFKLIYEENFEEVYRKEGAVPQFPTVVSDNLNIEIPYAEYRVSPTEIRQIEGKLEWVPTDDGLLWWKLLESNFLTE